MSYTTIKATDGSGSFNAYIAKPDTAKAPAIIMIQEIFGVNGEMRKKCDLWASRGYIAIAPDLFWRQEPGVDITDKTQAEWDKAFALYNGFDAEKGVQDLVATLDFIRADSHCNGKVGAIGYCLGGNLAYQMACKSTVDASISYYGVGIDGMLGDAVSIQKPILMHIAQEDKFVPKDAQAKIISALSPIPHVTLHSYEGVNHAFTRLNGEHFDEAAASLANQRSSDFIIENLESS